MSRQEYVDCVAMTWTWICQGCGCVVADKDDHDKWHEKTRSVV